jgi:NADPH-dependent curcumin reductase CurA
MSIPSHQVVENIWDPNIVEDSVGCRGFGKCVLLVKRPEGKITHDCFETVVRPIPEDLALADNELFIQQELLSMDPTHSIWIRDMPQYSPRVGLNTIMRASGVGKVLRSGDESKFPVGSHVIMGLAGIAEYLVMNTGMCVPCEPGVPLSWYLGPLFFGMGHTAWVGTKICDIKAGDTYVVSGAAGAVGSIAGQLGKMYGARVIGIAGGTDKCRMIVDELGFDAAVDYKSGKVEEALRRLCPNGIDGYFDNVGGEILDICLSMMNVFGRIAFCGAISSYDGNMEDGKSVGPSNYKMILMKRLKVQGFVCRDHSFSKPESAVELLAACKDGRIKFKEDIRESPIENYVDVVNLLFTGGNTGKLIMKIAN